MIYFAVNLPKNVVLRNAVKNNVVLKTKTRKKNAAKFPVTVDLSAVSIKKEEEIINVALM